MAQPSTLYRFRVDLTDVDRGVYDSLDFRVAMHPSESEDFLVTRVLAYALNIQDDLLFSKEGLGTPEEPCLSVADPGGGYKLWIEIGNPSVKKIHKATKTGQKVKIYTYKNPEHLIQELLTDKIYQPERIELYSFSDQFLEALATTLARDNSWNVIHQEASLTIQVGDKTIDGDVKTISLDRLLK
jgi:uncharacterized protein YaeQ